MMASTQRTALTVVVIVLTAMAVLVAAYLIYRLSTVIEWLILSIFLAVALEPAASILRKRGVTRVPAILIVFLLVFVIIALAVALALPPLVQQSKSIITALQKPGGLTEQVQRLATPLGLSGLVQTFRGQIDSLPGQLASAVGTLTTVTSNAVGAVAATGTVIVLTFFMLNDGERLVTGFVGLLPQRIQPRMRRVLDQSARAVSGYITGNLAISAIAGAGAFIAMTLLGVPYALALAVLLAICDLIPLVGGTLGAIAPILAAFGISPLKALVLLVYIIVYQQVENHVLNPLVYGRSVHLPGLVVFLAVLVGGILMGILGALIAIPVAEILRLVAIELHGGHPERSFQAAVPSTTVNVKAV